MGIRQEMVKQLRALLDNRFIYGGYKTKPVLPYGNYAREESNYFYSDDTLTKRINEYIVRVVTEVKDFSLEENIEQIYIDLDIPFRVVTDEDIDDEKVHCTEWIIFVLED